MIHDLDIIVTPLNEYLKMPWGDITIFQMHMTDFRPAFMHETNATTYLPLTPELIRYIEHTAASMGDQVRFKKSNEPRFHETTWQKANRIEECP